MSIAVREIWGSGKVRHASCVDSMRRSSSKDFSWLGSEDNCIGKIRHEVDIADFSIKWAGKE